MDIEPDRIEASVRLLTNGRYTWHILYNVPSTMGPDVIAGNIKRLDSALRDAFPTHVSVSSFKVSDVSED
jgi:hypothetical protein